MWSIDNQRYKALTLVAAATLKFAWLSGITTWLIARPLHIVAGSTTHATPVTIVQWLQLATALTGGLIALGLSLSVKQITQEDDLINL